MPGFTFSPRNSNTNSNRWTAAALWVALVLVACGKQMPRDAGDVSVQRATISRFAVSAPELCYRGAIQPIIANNCLNCHGVGGHALPTLNTYAAIAAVKTNALVLIQNGRMPATGVWTSDADKQNLMSWLGQSNPVDACASPTPTPTPPPMPMPTPTPSPTPNPNPTPAPTPTPAAGDLPRVDYETFTTPHMIMPDHSGDEMYNEIIPLTGLEPSKTYNIVGVQTDAVEIASGHVSPLLHHALVMKGAPGQKPRQMMSPDFGSLGNIQLIDWILKNKLVGRLIDRVIGPKMMLFGGYVKGANTFILPEGYGIVLPGNSTLTLSIHFNDLFAPDADKNVRLRIRYMFAERIQRQAYMSLEVNPQWVVDEKSMLIPADSPATSHGYTVTPWDYVHTKTNRLDLLGVLYHMHNLGVAAKLSLVQGKHVTLINEDKHFNYAHQYMRYFPTPLTLVKGRDQLNAQCTWDNSQKNQPVVNGQQISPIDVMWGEGTLNEMCMWVSVYGDHK
jgi:hypothetical protein